MELFESGSVRELIFVLLPGFVAAWVFYGLTPHPKLNQFERTVQAFIFLAFVRVMMWGVEAAGLTSPPAEYSMGVLGQEATFAWSLLCGVLIGVVFSACANHDFPHVLLQWLKLTKRTSFPNEWSSTFNRKANYVVLHVKDRPRAMGMPVEFPDDPNVGHFVLCDACWLDDDGKPTELDVVERLLIRARDVVMVETLKIPAEDEICEPAEPSAVDPNMEANRDGSPKKRWGTGRKNNKRKK